MSLYTKKFYDSQATGSERSAKEVIPEVLKFIKPKSVIDVGCGVGTWLSVFQDFGITDVLGVDGDWVKKQLRIPKDNFRSHNLTELLKINRKFDLVTSLEVAEHLPADKAETFITSLTSLGDIILFSAAILFQGGIPHINEQFPDYWAKLFGKRNFLAVDAIRPLIWSNQNVEFWYCQNIIMYIKSEVIDDYPLLKSEYQLRKNNPLSLVHPRGYLQMAKSSGISNMPLKQIVKSIPVATSRTIIRKMRGIKNQPPKQY